MSHVATSVARDVVRVAGPDAAAYLQGQISQDVEALATGDSAWSLILQPQGKVDAWFRLHRVADDEFVIDLDAGFSDALVARLERFKLRTDVSIEVLDGWSMIAIRGDGPVDVDHPTGALVAAVDWPGFAGLDIVTTDAMPPATIPTVDTDVYDARRIEAGWPAMGAELTADTIPAEAHIVDLSVSFTKGCFTGQELVARIDSRGGNVPHPIRRLGATGRVDLAVGDAVRSGDVEVGRVTSVGYDSDRDRTVALAAVQRKIEPGQEVAVGTALFTVAEVRSSEAG